MCAVLPSDELTHMDFSVAEEHGMNHPVDYFYRYGTDGNAAVRAGNNIQAAAFGMGTFLRPSK